MSKRSQDHEWKYSAATIQSPGNDTEIIDVVMTSFKPSCHIRKVSKNEYITGAVNSRGEFISDGIVYEFAQKEEQMRNRRSLRQIFRTLRQLISQNFKGGLSELFVTLSYADQHNDPNRIYSDIELFWKRLKYKYNGLKYIAIVEPHASGNFHVHLLLADTNGGHLYIPNEELQKIWGLGWTKTERLEDIDHMGAYFIAYFTNMELSEEQIAEYAAQGDIETKNGKSYIKGKRLDFYPEHMRIYRHSKNCEKPVKITGVEVGEIIAASERTYSHEARFEQNGNEYTILTEQYRRRLED